MRGHFTSHLRVWLGLVVLVVAANEIVDRNFFDHREHIDGDLVITVLVLMVTISISYAVAWVRARARTAQ